MLGIAIVNKSVIYKVSTELLHKLNHIILREFIRTMVSNITQICRPDCTSFEWRCRDTRGYYSPVTWLNEWCLSSLWPKVLYFVREIHENVLKGTWNKDQIPECCISPKIYILCKFKDYANEERKWGAQACAKILFQTVLSRETNPCRPRACRKYRIDPIALLSRYVAHDSVIRMNWDFLLFQKRKLRFDKVKKAVQRSLTVAWQHYNTTGQVKVPMSSSHG